MLLPILVPGPRRAALRTLSLAGLVVGSLMAGAVAAHAGECPADKRMAGVTKPVANGPEGVTDTVLSAIDLAKEKPGLKGSQMRVRRLVIQPGGVVPWHSHAERPALIYVVSGEIYEHASDCAVPILHKAGEIARETHTTAHWWKNTGGMPVVLLSFDILSDPNDKHM